MERYFQEACEGRSPRPTVGGGGWHLVCALLVSPLDVAGIGDGVGVGLVLVEVVLGETIVLGVGRLEAAREHTLRDARRSRQAAAAW